MYIEVCNRIENMLQVFSARFLSCLLRVPIRSETAEVMNISKPMPWFLNILNKLVYMYGSVS